VPSHNFSSKLGSLMFGVRPESTPNASAFRKQKKLCWLFFGSTLLLVVLCSFGSLWPQRAISRFTTDHACLNVSCVVSLSSAKRMAYVITLNTSSPRYLQTSSLLRGFGFHVTPVQPPYIGETRHLKTLSNKAALFTAVSAVSTGNDNWGYLFEDDVCMHELWDARGLSEILQSEASSPYFQYLGVCSLEKPQRRMCGRCAHAMGFSKIGAKEFLKFSQQLNHPLLASGNSPWKEPYFDIVAEGWCRQHAGFPVIGPLERSGRGEVDHYGAFIQDRVRFDSEIDKAVRT